MASMSCVLVIVPNVVFRPRKTFVVKCLTAGLRAKASRVANAMRKSPLTSSLKLTLKSAA